ncbi:hypothetical protein H3Z83_01860 [Tenacibaculum sp. S7007]|uniref:DUF4412 domain-containing protein n=1 Tax=Tenacibaculum pelagium TaxID=2759527 RepID=A0A839AJI7_9FLAO|nr:hypothetical protein [Tenacibaculum pelagium]MBA6155273.1 hypothetical protein [Tenacibaculum pelagium]
MKKFLVVLLLSVSAISMSQEKVLLRLNYEVGANYEMSMKMNNDMGVALMDMDMNMNIEVTGKEEESFLTKTSFTYMAMKVLQGAEEKVNYNSNMKDEELSAEGKKFKSQIAPMMEAVMFSKTSNLGEAKIIKVEPNTPGIEQYVNQSNRTVVYPKEEVTVGSTWTNTQSNQGISMELTYTVKEITKDKVFTTLSGNMSMMPGAKITGSTNIDRASGIPIKSVINIEIDMMGKVVKNTVVGTMSKL